MGWWVKKFTDFTYKYVFLWLKLIYLVRSVRLFGVILNFIITVSYITGFCCFFSKILGNPGQGGMKAVLGVKWSTNHSPTERAKFLYISIFNAKKVDGKINYFLLQNQSLQHTSTIPRNPGKIKTLIEN